MFRLKISTALVTVLLICANASWVQAFNVTAETKDGQPTLTIHSKDTDPEAHQGNFTQTFSINGQTHELAFQGGVAEMDLTNYESGLVLIESKQQPQYVQLTYLNLSQGVSLKKIPLWLSILPPLIAIGLALLLKEAIISLFAGIWVGVFIAGGMSVSSIFSSFLRIIDTYIVSALNDSGHLSIIVFSLLIGGMVAIITKNGGMLGVVNFFSKYAKSARSAQLVTWLLGVLIFFDDYANTLIVGNTMRPVTDRFKVSREKLAYIVDSTAAPIAAIAFFTTWIGAELGYIGDALAKLDIETSPYAMFLGSLKYAYYPVFTLGFMFLLIWTRKDFASMHTAEVQARNASNGVSENDSGQQFVGKPKALNAFLPVLTLILVTVVGLLYSGYDIAVWNSTDSFLSKLSSSIGNADSYAALLWASLCSISVALLLSVSQGILKLGESMEVAINGFKTLLPAVLILTCAWSLALVTEELHTATYLTNLLSGSLDPLLLPLISFILAGVVSFSTGSSWSTMAILYPIILPTTWTIGTEAGLDADSLMEVMLNTTSVILAGSVFGDHCSPISDTTILSSLASDCDHISHVRTQMPYALITGFVSILTGGLLFYIGVPWWINFLIGFALLFGLVKWKGKVVADL